MHAKTEKSQIRLTRTSSARWRITFDNPPLNLMGPRFVREFRELITAIEADRDLKVVVFDSAVESFFLNHSDFLADCWRSCLAPTILAPSWLKPMAM